MCKRKKIQKDKMACDVSLIVSSRYYFKTAWNVFFILLWLLPILNFRLYIFLSINYAMHNSISADGLGNIALCNIVLYKIACVRLVCVTLCDIVSCKCCLLCCCMVNNLAVLPLVLNEFTTTMFQWAVHYLVSSPPSINISHRRGRFWWFFGLHF